MTTSYEAVAKLGFGATEPVAAYEEIAQRVAAADPDIIVIASPHAPLYRDGFSSPMVREAPAMSLPISELSRDR